MTCRKHFFFSPENPFLATATTVPERDSVLLNTPDYFNDIDTFLMWLERNNQDFLTAVQAIKTNKNYFLKDFWKEFYTGDPKRRVRFLSSLGRLANILALFYPQEILPQAKKYLEQSVTQSVLAKILPLADLVEVIVAFNTPNKMTQGFVYNDLFNIISMTGNRETRKKCFQAIYQNIEETNNEELLKAILLCRPVAEIFYQDEPQLFLAFAKKITPQLIEKIFEQTKNNWWLYDYLLFLDEKTFLYFANSQKPVVGEEEKYQKHLAQVDLANTLRQNTVLNEKHLKLFSNFACDIPYNQIFAQLSPKNKKQLFELAVIHKDHNFFSSSLGKKVFASFLDESFSDISQAETAARQVISFFETAPNKQKKIIVRYNDFLEETYFRLATANRFLPQNPVKASQLFQEQIQSLQKIGGQKGNLSWESIINLQRLSFDLNPAFSSEIKTAVQKSKNSIEKGFYWTLAKKTKDPNLLKQLLPEMTINVQNAFTFIPQRDDSDEYLNFFTEEILAKIPNKKNIWRVIGAESISYQPYHNDEIYPFGHPAYQQRMIDLYWQNKKEDYLETDLKTLKYLFCLGKDKKSIRLAQKIIQAPPFTLSEEDFRMVALNYLTRVKNNIF